MIILSCSFCVLCSQGCRHNGCVVSARAVGYVPPSEISLDPDWVFLSYDDVVRLFGAAGLVAGLLPLLQVTHSRLRLVVSHCVVLIPRFPTGALVRCGCDRYSCCCVDPHQLSRAEATRR
jgi:hypothetical protein